MVGDTLNAPFTLVEMKRALANASVTSPGKDEMCYIMMAHLSDTAMEKVLNLYNKMWQKGKLPASWNQVVVMPIRKPVENPTSP
jgi:hypothetical protein